MGIQTDAAIARYLQQLSAVEDDALRAARARSAGGGSTATGGMPPVSPDTGAFLQLIARITGAANGVEIGSGGGYSGIWIARGLAPEGILTTIEADPQHQQLAKDSYRDAGVAGSVRSLGGPALEVLPRLADGAFDLVFIDADKPAYPDYLEHALRLTQPGAVILADNVLWSGRVADPDQADPDTEALRLYNRRIVEDPRLHSVILTIGDGLAVSWVRG